MIQPTKNLTTIDGSITVSLYAFMVLVYESPAMEPGICANAYEPTSVHTKQGKESLVNVEYLLAISLSIRKTY